MIKSICDIVQRQCILRRVEFALLNNSINELIDLRMSSDEIINLIIEAAEAALLMVNADIRKPQFAFCTLYARLKTRSEPEHIFLKTYCLYYLALLRGAHADCFFHASKAYKMRGVRRVRRALRMPRPVERNMIGTFIAASS